LRQKGTLWLRADEKNLLQIKKNWVALVIDGVRFGSKTDFPKRLLPRRFAFDPVLLQPKVYLWRRRF
jgi:hypothetical protein